MNNDLRPINTIPNFKRFCMTIGELPTSYLETMSYYEMLVWFTEYMKNTIIPTINNNGLAVEELQNKYNELKSYVDNYFTNLDVQQEINNKLDQMAVSGQLTDIIAQYLGLAGILVFNNVNDMKQATNLVNGSTCQTLGFYNINDGGKATYKIRNITNQDVIDNGNIIPINNNLIAELIKNDYCVPEIYGAFGDGNSHPLSELYNNLDEAKITYPFATSLNDEIDGLAIQKTINNFEDVKLNSKRYIINTNLLVKNNLKIYGCGQDSKIISSNNDIFIFNDESSVDIGFLTLRCENNFSCITINGSYWKNNRIHDLIIAGGKYFITNAYINNASKNTYGIIYDCSISNIWIYSGLTYALYIKGSGHFNFTIEKLHNGTGSVYLSEGYFKFVDCNFGLKNGTTFIADAPATILIMERCNIECDELINESNIFKIKSSKSLFNLCDFVIRLNTDINLIELSENASDIRFQQCRQIKYPENLGKLFYNNLTIGSSRLNAIKFIGSPSLLSDLTFSNLATVYKSAVRFDYENDIQYIYQNSQLNSINNRTLFIYSDNKLYYKHNDKYYNMDGTEKIFE